MARRQWCSQELESRLLLTVNIGVTRQGVNDLMVYELDTEPLTGTRNANPEIVFEFGETEFTPGGEGVDDVTLVGDFSGVGFDQAITYRPDGDGFVFSGDTDRDSGAEYLFVTGYGPHAMIADMNGDGYDDAITAQSGSSGKIWSGTLAQPGPTPFPTDGSGLGGHYSFRFGSNADIPLAGDFNGDGRADVVSVHNNGVSLDWSISYLTEYPDDQFFVLPTDLLISGFGSANDVPVVGDWDGDGIDNIGFVDETTSPVTWNLDTDGGGAAEITLQYGQAGDRYLVGRWADRVWDGEGGDSNWNTAPNWSGDTVPGSSDTVVIDQPGSVVTVNVNGTSAVDTIVSRETVQLSAQLAATQRQDFQNGIVLATDIELTGAAGGLTDVNLGGNTLTLSYSGDVSLDGSITGTGDLIKTGNGILTVNTINLFSGTTYLDGGTLKGSGTLTGPLEVGSSATVAPGNSPGILNTGNFTLSSGATLEMEIGGIGANPGIDYDQVNVTGTVTLAGTLHAIAYNTFSAGENYVIINNDGVDAVTGTFDGLAQGATVFVGDYAAFTVSYTGGDGNDVVLTSILNVGVVSNTLDIGAGSLADAITDASSSVGPDVIVFTTAGTIASTIAMPALNGSILIDATTAPGYAGSPVVELSGVNTTGVDGLRLQGTGFNEVRGLAINQFDNNAVYLLSDNNTVAGNYLGTDLTGTVALGNAQGIYAFGTSSNVIGGITAADRNVISGNLNSGVTLQLNADLNTILGNYIGVAADGVTALPNATSGGDPTAAGIKIDRSADNVIGGTGPLSRNIVSGNDLRGIHIFGVGASGNLVLGNFIGTSSTGGLAVPNNGNGVTIAGSAAGNTIGGTTGVSGNVISGNTNNGLEITGAAATGNVVIGNVIGTDALGLIGIPNNHGVVLTGSTSGNRIGTDGDGSDDLAERNVISGNDSSGVLLIGAGANSIAGNFIGLDATGTFALPNLDGVFIQSSTGSIIGTDGSNDLFNASERNYISGNADRGIVLDGDNAVAGNWIGLDINGTAVGQGYGIQVTGTGSRIGTDSNGIADADERNVISGNSINGIIMSATSATVAGNFIGTDPTGMLAVPNAGQGISLNGGGLTTIGGTAPGAGNLISGNGGSGIIIWAAGSNNNQILGNSIGVAADGETPLGNLNGVRIEAGDGNVVGGGAAGAGNVIAGNVIDVGVYFADSTNTRIQGNTISLNTAGTTLIAPTGGFGIHVAHGAVNTIIGTDSNGIADAGEGNLVGMASTAAIFLQSVTTSPVGTVIAGNRIGINQAGTAGLSADGAMGIRLEVVSDVRVGTNADGTNDAGERNVVVPAGNSSTAVALLEASNVIIAGNAIGTNAAGTIGLGSSGSTGIAIIDLTGSSTGNVIGGTVAAARNIISGTGTGVQLHGSGVTGAVVSGNYIGTDFSGIIAISNVTGVSIENGASGNTIGGTAAGARNVISGNTDSGVAMTGVGTSGNAILGNLIGTRAAGTTALGNQVYGVEIDSGASGNSIGGTNSAARNIISGNGDRGIHVGPTSSANVIQGNYVGLDPTGTVALGNGFLTDVTGVHIQGPNNIIGGTVPGAGNVISGNANWGLAFYLSSATGNVAQGNYIGTNASGTAAVGNVAGGVRIWAGASGNTVGGTAPGAANLISGNTGDGITISSGATTGNIVTGNLIGTNAAGTAALGNSSAGVQVESNASLNVIGGTSVAERNIISGNLGSGISISAATTNTITGNYIGTDVSGSLAIGNNHGIEIRDAAGGNVIGGNVPGAANLISGNSGFGMNISQSGAPGNLVRGNLIGTDATGSFAVGNQLGIMLSDAADNQIGGTGPGDGNLISGNDFGGLFISGALATGNVVQGNRIGTDISGLLAVPNRLNGLTIGTGTGNTIGGSAAGAGNVIANNLGSGIRLEGSSGNTNTVQGNNYYGNLTIGIDAGPVGRTVNDSPDVDGVLNYPVITSTQIVGTDLIVDGTMASGATIELHISAPTTDGNGQGQQRLATLADNSGADENAAAGVFRVRVPLGNGVGHGTPLTALTLGSTSEFSPVVIAGELGSSLAPIITLDSTALTLNEGGRLDVGGSFYDPDSTSWSATVDYGDGSGPLPLSLGVDNTFQLSHVYPDRGNFTITVRITDNSAATGIGAAAVGVINQAPEATFNEFTMTSPANEGQLVTLTGEFQDSGGIHSIDVDWGDGHTDTIPIAPGDRSFAATHVYADDSNPDEFDPDDLLPGEIPPPVSPTAADIYRVVVTVRDDAGLVDSTPIGLFLEEIHNVRPTDLDVDFSSMTLIEGDILTLDGSFTDPGLVDAHKVRVDWGDGVQTVHTLTVGARSFSGISHQYVDDPADGPDQYVVTVELWDDDEPLRPVTSPPIVVTVANQVPHTVMVTATPAVIDEDGEVMISGSFVDAGTQDAHRVRVVWGDGSPDTVVTLDPEDFVIPTLTHTYLNNLPGEADYQVRVFVSDLDSAPGVAGEPTTPVVFSVSNVAPVVTDIRFFHGTTELTLGQAIPEGETITVIGSFTDVSSVDRHTVAIEWGDGSADTNAVVDSATRTFRATHRYADDSTATDDSWQILVSVTDDEDTTTASASQVVSNVTPAVEVVPGAGSTQNLLNLASVVKDPAGTLDAPTYAWRAWPTSNSSDVRTGAGATLQIDRSGYATGIAWIVELTVDDGDGGVATARTVLLAGTDGNDSLILNDATFTSNNVSRLMVLGLAGEDVINGTAVATASHTLILDGGDGQDFLYGGSGDDVYYLQSGNDVANYTAANGTLPGAVPINGGIPGTANMGGDDRYRLKPNSILSVVDTTGNNVLDFGLADFGDDSGIVFDLDEASSATFVVQDVSSAQPSTHYVQTLGTFTDLDGSRYADTLTGATDATVSSGDGDDQLYVKSGTIGARFFGGADDDVLTIAGNGVTGLNFGGDDGLDTLTNTFSIGSLTFGGGADDDVLTNSGTITDLIFGGGADDDVLNNSGSITTILNFGGDDGIDALFNTGAIGDLTFSGGADDDILVNHGGATTTTLDFFGDDDVLLTGSGTIGTLTFNGDEGADTLVNLNGITTLIFTGGADDDVLVNVGTAAITLNFGGEDETLLSGTGSIGDLTFGGDDGADTLTNIGAIGMLDFSGGADDDVLTNSGTITDLIFGGGADDDVLTNTGSVMTTLTFGGDDGVDALFNTGSVAGTLTFNGGADDDILVNNGATTTLLDFAGDDDVLLTGSGIVGSLDFNGDEGADTLVNLGTVTTLTFGGGADDDTLVNAGSGVTELDFGGDDETLLSGTGSIGDLNFGGDDGADTLINTGEVTGALTFGGGADDDTLVNTGDVTGTLTFGGDTEFVNGVWQPIQISGDDGADTLVNSGSIGGLVFTGGADDDVLVNQNTGGITTLNFGGDDGAETLLNAGTIGSLTFGGGADDDILLNQDGGTITTLTFGGDDGSDALQNQGTVTTLTFGGGADDDVLVNTGSVGTLAFGGDSELENGVFQPNTVSGDDGADVLVNTGSIGGLTFGGGADDDVLLNRAAGTITTLNFSGDDGADVLQNEGVVTTLTFMGGADDDVLINNGNGVTTLTFGGDDGDDILLNAGSGIGELDFSGGADDDVLQNNGSDIGSLTFGGDDGQDILINNGSSVGALDFTGGADDDVLINNGENIGSITFGGDVGLVAGQLPGDDTLIIRGSGSGDVDATILFNGGAGIDAFQNNATGFASITFHGGADDDVMQNNASGIGNLTFDGGADDDVLENNGDAVSTLTFHGDDGSDILANDGNNVSQLTFNGGADDDVLINTGVDTTGLTFNGGADDDVLLNTGSGLSNLEFNGDGGDDVLVNTGAGVSDILFGGDDGNDRFWNQATGVQSSHITFNGDDGSDVLINDGAGVTDLTFNGGADDDGLQNNGGSVTGLTFNGGADDDVLINTGSGVTELEFNGDLGNDAMRQSGLNVGTVVFNGDEGDDLLVNTGSVGSLTFNGGADADVLQNNGTSVGTLTFGGDDGADILVSNGPVGELNFGGGADDDTLQNNGTVTTLTFGGGGDNDLLVNNGDAVGTLLFHGDDGADTLINNGDDLGSLVFNGGADGDTLRTHGRGLGAITFNAGPGSDGFHYNSTGLADSSVTFNAGDGDDFFAWRGSAGSLNFDGGPGRDTTIILGSGALTLDGGADSDRFYFQSRPMAPTSVTLTESHGVTGDLSSDTLDFSAWTGGALNLDLRQTTPQQQSTNFSLTIDDGLGIENIVGTPLGDTIYGNARDNYLAGAQFTTELFGPVAGLRQDTQWVLLDFTRTDESAGEHLYDLAEREQIRSRVEAVYRGPDTNQPWFDVRVTLDANAIPANYKDAGQYVTIYFNDTPAFGRPGGLASEIDPGNANLDGSAAVQVNGLLGGVITSQDIVSESVTEGDKGDLSFIGDEEIGADKPVGTSENFVLLSSKIAAHELAHLLGLRHADSFGPIGYGLHDPPGVSGYKPVYTGPVGGVETFDHILGSPASIGSDRFNDLNDLFFGEREAIKLAWAFSDPTDTTTLESTAAHNSAESAQPLTLVGLNVPNTLGSGLNEVKSLSAQIQSVEGTVELDGTTSESDWYSFTGLAGQLINIDVLSNSVSRFGSDANHFVDSIVRVWYDVGGTPTLVPYYGGVAVNDDIFEPTDSSIIDLILPVNGTYYIEIDTFHRDPQDPSYAAAEALRDELLARNTDQDTENDLTPSELQYLDRLTDTLHDTDTGRYQLIISRFARASASDDIDDIKGYGGVDIIDGGPGDEFSMEYSLGDDVLLTAGTTFSRTVTVTDRAASDWDESTVSYGDSPTPLPLLVDSNGTFLLNHQYTTDGTFTVTVTIRNDIGQVQVQTLTVTVGNVEPQLNPLQLSSGPYTEGSTITLDGTFVDSSAGDTHQVVIIWGDGSDNTVIDLTSGERAFSVTHVYADNGQYAITSTITDSGGETTTGTANLTVANLSPEVSPQVYAITENSAAGTAVGVVVAGDPGINDSLTWGIVGGTGSTAFAIDPQTGAITVADPSQLDFETAPSFSLTVKVTDDDGASSTAEMTINLINLASITGVVYVDFDQDGEFDANEVGLDNVTIELLDAAGDVLFSTVTADGGMYLFEDLAAGTYRIREVQPPGVTDGIEQLGQIGGTVSGTIVSNDVMELMLTDVDAASYNFSEFGGELSSGDTAGIGFWQNKHGQELIRLGGTDLANWLTTTFDNIFGDYLNGASGDDVADFYRNQLFKQKGKKVAGPAKVDAQFLAVAFAVYFTDSSLAGTAATAFGFNVSATGAGSRVVNVGSAGEAFDVADGSSLTIMQLLLATNSLTDQPDDICGFAHIYDKDGDGQINAYEAGLRHMANDLFDWINGFGGI